MIASRDRNYVTVEAYLEGETVSPIRHEYWDGALVAMVGASDLHNGITFNLTGLLYGHLRGGDCRGYAADMKLKVPLQERYYYPDLFVTCDLRDREADAVKQFPRLIVEVLSESTEDVDRGRKWKDYRRIETLEEYVLISQDEVFVEVLRRNRGAKFNLWVRGGSLGCWGELGWVEKGFLIADFFEDGDGDFTARDFFDGGFSGGLNEFDDALAAGGGEGVAEVGGAIVVAGEGVVFGELEEELLDFFGGFGWGFGFGGVVVLGADFVA